MKKRIIAVLIAVASFSLVGASHAASIKVGASLPLTGMFAVPGSKPLEGYQMCVDMINANGGWLCQQVELLATDNR